MVEEDKKKCGTCWKQNHRKKFMKVSKIKENNVEDKPLPPSFVCSEIMDQSSYTSHSYIGLSNHLYNYLKNYKNKKKDI